MCDELRDRSQELGVRRQKAKARSQEPQLSLQDGKKIESCEEYQVETQEYQGGSTAILMILKTQVSTTPPPPLHPLLDSPTFQHQDILTPPFLTPRDYDNKIFWHPDI